MKSVKALRHEKRNNSAADIGLGMKFGMRLLTLCDVTIK